MPNDCIFEPALEDLGTGTYICINVCVQRLIEGLRCLVIDPKM